jgi:hypothetical protein
VLAIVVGLAHAVFTDLLRWLVRGMPERQMAMLSTLRPDVLIPEDHPIRRIRMMVTRCSRSSTTS